MTKLKNANEPFTIFLDNDQYRLTAKALQEQVDSELQRKRAWHYANLKFISLHDGVLYMQNSNRDKTYTMRIGIEADKLHVSCDCGMQASTICIHSYRALQQCSDSLWGNYFKDYCPGGLVETAIAHKKNFEIRDELGDLDISPKKELGYVYPFSGKESVLLQSLAWIEANAATALAAKQTVLTYCIMHPFKNKLLPFIVPCAGILNTAGNRIKGFYPFLSGTQKEYESQLSESQKTINHLSYEIWQNTEPLPGLIMKMNAEQKMMLHEIFTFWKKAWPLLMQESFVFGYLLHGIRELRSKPVRRKLWPLTLSADAPHLQFILKEKAVFHQLEMRVLVKGKLIEPMPSPAMMIRTEGYLYLLQNLRDAAIAEWILKSGNRITVFTAHQEDFEKNILNTLRENYPVKFIPKKTKTKL